MAKYHSYPPEFRAKIIELHRAGRSVKDLAREFEPGQQTIRNWIKQDDVDGGRRADGLTSAERDEISRLRRKVRQLELEREILSKATAWFARETDATRSRSSSS